MPTNYQLYKIPLTEGQRNKIDIAFKQKTGTVIQLNNRKGLVEYDAPLTARQIKKIEQKGKKIRLTFSAAQIKQVKTKEGGFLPLIPLLIAGITAAATVAGSGAGIAEAVHSKQAQDKQTAETKRHNIAKEQESRALRRMLDAKNQSKQIGNPIKVKKGGFMLPFLGNEWIKLAKNVKGIVRDLKYGEQAKIGKGLWLGMKKGGGLYLGKM